MPTADAASAASAHGGSSESAMLRERNAALHQIIGQGERRPGVDAITAAVNRKRRLIDV
jgi:hypothetical protein